MSGRPHLRFYLAAVRALIQARAAVLLQPSQRHFERGASTGAPAAIDEIDLVRRTIGAASRRLPFRTQCYEQALAARSLLAKRGFSSRLHFGTGKNDGDLTAHVWLTSGELIVVGEEEAARHVELARSPE